MTHRKTATFAILHMIVAFGVVYLLTGSWALGGAVALLEPAINTLAYFFHEKAWERSRPAPGQATGRACRTTPPGPQPANMQGCPVSSCPWAKKGAAIRESSPA